MGAHVWRRSDAGDNSNQAPNAGPPPAPQLGASQPTSTQHQSQPNQRPSEQAATTTSQAPLQHHTAHSPAPNPHAFRPGAHLKHPAAAGPNRAPLQTTAPSNRPHASHEPEGPHPRPKLILKRPHEGSVPQTTDSSIPCQPAQQPLIKRPRAAGGAPHHPVHARPAHGQHPKPVGPAKVPGPTAASTSAPQTPAVGEELAQKEAELAELKRKLLEMEATVSKQKEAEAQRDAVRLQQQQQAEAAQRRKAQLAKGFKSIAVAHAHNTSTAANGSQAPQAEGAVPKIQVQVADEWEVARVLDCKNDYECLKLHVGAGLAQVKRNFRSMAVSLHPDKCKLDGAAAAFQRVKQAYEHLSSS